MEQEQYETNPKFRCIKCNGRLVTKTNADGTKTRNLVLKDGQLVCKDIKECEQNIESEQNILDVVVGDNQFGLYDRKKGEELFFVAKKDDTFTF
jgi:hypothetical protein